MTGRIKNSNDSTLVKPSIDLTVMHNNFKTLSPDEASDHLAGLEIYLQHATDLIAGRLKGEFFDHSDHLIFIREIVKTLQLFLLKNRMMAMSDSSEPALTCSIDPSHSGFPVFLRDFRFLAADKARAAAETLHARPDGSLVDDALYYIFQGSYPTEIILEKLLNTYHEKLFHVDIFDEEISFTQDAKRDGDGYYVKEIAYRLNGDDNLPQVYTFCFTVSERMFEKNTSWRQMFQQNVLEGMNTTSDLELGYLANRLGALEAIDLQLIERYTFGPFYSRHTEKGDGMGHLFDAGKPGDGILLFEKQTVHKVGENRRRTWTFFNTKRISNTFSPVLRSPRYALMPHRFIQMAHRSESVFTENIKMFGITEQGELVD